MIRVKAQTVRDSVVVEHEPAGVWSIRDGKICRIRLYLDRDDALREARSPQPNVNAYPETPGSN
jgi:ketosteroid isomerase-like protein